MKTREEALLDLRDVLAAAADRIAALTPMEAAQAAWRPGGPPVEELAAQIAADRETRTEATPPRE